MFKTYAKGQDKKHGTPQIAEDVHDVTVESHKRMEPKTTEHHKPYTANGDDTKRRRRLAAI